MQSLSEKSLPEKGTRIKYGFVILNEVKYLVSRSKIAIQKRDFHFTDNDKLTPYKIWLPFSDSL